MALANEEFKKYQNLLKSNQANLKAELGAIRDKSMATSENYLKQLGLQGSGVGQTAQAQMNTNYSNAIANLNAQNQASEQAWKEDYTNKMTNAYQNMIERGASYSDLKKFESEHIADNNVLTPGTNSYINALRESSGATLENEKIYNNELLSELYANESDNIQKSHLSSIQDKLKNASEEQYSDYSEIIKQLSNGYITAKDALGTMLKLDAKRKYGDFADMKNNGKVMQKNGQYYYNNGGYVQVISKEHFDKIKENNGEYKQ